MQQLFFVDVSNRHRVEARIDVADIARDAAREVGEQERSRVAHFLDRHGAAERRILFHHMKKLAEALDAGSRKRLDGTSRNGVGADAFTAERLCKIARRRVERSLRKAHRVVIGNSAFAAKIRERQAGRIAALHERQEGLGERRIGIGRDVERRMEGFARKAFKEVARNRFAGRIADRMNEAVKAAPLFSERFHNAGNLLVARHVHRKHDAAAELFGEALQTLFKAGIRVGEGELSTFAIAGFGDAVGDGAVGDDARDQELLASQESHVGPRFCL